MLADNIENALRREAMRKHVVAAGMRNHIVSEKPIEAGTYPHFLFAAVIIQGMDIGSEVGDAAKNGKASRFTVIDIDASVLGGYPESARRRLCHHAGDARLDVIGRVSGLKIGKLPVVLPHYIYASEVRAYPHVLLPVTQNGIDGVVAQAALVSEAVP